MTDEISLAELFTGVASPEPVEAVFGEELFISRMDSLENLLLINFVCSALLVGCMLASVLLMWFHRR